MFAHRPFASGVACHLCDDRHSLRDDRATFEESCFMTIAPADLIEGMAKGMAVLESFDTERQRLNATLAAEASRHHPGGRPAAFAHAGAPGLSGNRWQLLLAGQQGAAPSPAATWRRALAAPAAAHADRMAAQTAGIVFGRGAGRARGGHCGSQRRAWARLIWVCCRKGRVGCARSFRVSLNSQSNKSVRGHSAQLSLSQLSSGPVALWP
jgi:hypothetical protein